MTSLHYRKQALCRVPRALLTVIYRALGKEHLCRVPRSANLGTRQRQALGKATIWLGKDGLGDGCHPAVNLYQAPAVRHSVKIVFCNFFAECQDFDTRQRPSLPGAKLGTR
jgi:hypothetical protein